MHFFPPTLPDELLYSVLARYHAYSGNESHKNSVRDFFGSKTICAVTDLPCHLNKLSTRIPGKAISAYELLNDNTLLSYFKPFLPEERFKQAEEEMLHGDGSSLYMKLGLPANGVKNNKFLRYCTMCVDRDRLQYGIAYWHRAHQLPGVTVCHLHSSLLIDSNVPFLSRRNKHEFVSLEEVALPNVPTIRTSTEVKIAKYSYHILNSECDPGGGGTLRIIYLARLQEMGFVSPTGRLRFKLIIQAFIDLFGENFLNQIGCNIHPTEQYSWLHKVMRKEHFIMHPLRHILLHIFLGLPTHLSLSKREGVLQMNPFGEGPWPCLNKAAIHYKELIVTNCKVTRCSSTGKPVGTFSCVCGFIYSRRGSDKVMKDKYRIGRIKEFGSIWIKRLGELVEEGNYSLRAKALILGVDPTTVKNQMIKLNGSKIGVNHSKPTKKQIQITNKQNPIADVTIRNLSSQAQKRVNWEQRDNEIAEKVSSVVEQLYTIKNVRISKSEIGRKIGALSLIHNRLDKFPKTSKEVTKYVESTEEYRIRRISMAMNERDFARATRPDWKIAKELGISLKEFRRLMNVSNSSGNGS
ncbi:TnsD family Tn7-like transposition protein [Brevibacillus sp. NPDC003359]|uniref:TnsD family Tn7-like transposition protein n=1 Tax=unclassified Brevibacillus TaxID=2684853 RepID=UPI0036AAE864